MFNFEIYWDNSGTDKQSPIAVAAAYVATKTQWDEFVRNWDEAREEEGFDFFHMTDFMARAEAKRSRTVTGIKRKREECISD